MDVEFEYQSLNFTIDDSSAIEDYLPPIKDDDNQVLPSINFSLVSAFKSALLNIDFTNFCVLQHREFSDVQGGYFAVVILFLICGMAMQWLAIVYEWFHMDPMKRGLVNQLCTTYMVFAMCFSAARIIRYSMECLLPPPMPSFIFTFFEWVAWLAWSSCIGCLITINEVLFFTYWSKMWLKRVPNYNHDFLAAWLNLANFVIAFYYGWLQVYNFKEWAKDEENVPRIQTAVGWGMMILLLTCIYALHTLIDYWKSNDQPIYNIPVQEAPPLAMMLNTMQYNPDILNWKAAIASIFMIPIIFFCYFTLHFKEAPKLMFVNLVFCYFIPLFFYIFNPKLRKFVLGLFR